MDPETPATPIVTTATAMDTDDAATDQPVTEAAPSADSVPPAVDATPAPALAAGRLLESLDGGDGWRWRVQVIQSGTSLNRTHYPLSVLHARAALYEGVPVYFGRGEHHPDERGFASTAGWITDARPNPQGVEGTFELRRDQTSVREALLHHWEVYQRTGKLGVGFSHVIPAGKFTATVKRLAEGLVKQIEDFTEVESVDLVSRPSAGGRLLGLTASLDAEHERSLSVMDELLSRLRRGERLSESEIATLRAEAPEAYASALVEATEAASRRSLETLQKAECRALLSEKLAEASLPAPVKAHVRAEFERRGIFEAEDLESYIAAQRELAAKLVESASLPQTGSGEVTITEDERGKQAKALDGLFEGRDIDGVRRFTSLKQAFRVVSGSQREYIDLDLAHDLIREAQIYRPMADALRESIVSSTFGEMLGDSITRRALKEYNFPQFQSWRLISEVVPVQDFRTQRRMRMGGYGNLPDVGQGATYQNLTSPTDEEATYSASKRGGLEDLTLEAIVNDDVGVVRRIPVKLGRAAARTLHQYVWNTVIRDNATATYDSVALYHASHSNTGTAALSAANLLAAENAMRDQTAYNETAAVLGEANMPRLLVVPNELRDTAYKLTQSGMAVISNENATVPNIFQGRYQIVVNDDWTDANDWFLFADPMNVPVLEVGFLNGREEPDIFVQDQPNVGSNFSADKVTYKIRHIWGVGIMDHRGTYRNVVA